MEELTLADAARELGISRQRLQVIAKEKRLGRQVAGRYWIFTREEVEAFKPNIQGKAGRPIKIDGLPAGAGVGRPV